MHILGLDVYVIFKLMVYPLKYVVICLDFETVILHRHIVIFTS